MAKRLPLKIHSPYLKSIFGRPMKAPITKHARLILHVAVGVERHAPLLQVAEVAQPAQVEGSVSQPLQVMLEGFALSAEQLRSRFPRFCVGVDVAQRAAEADVQPSEFPGVARFSVRPNALLGELTD